MKAMMLNAFGGPDVLHMADVPAPEPAPNQTLVRVRACGVNYLDLWVRNGQRARGVTLPHILGSEIAGEVEHMGAAGGPLAPGQPVAVAPWLFCGHCEYCLRGEETLCLHSDIIGRVSQGGYAEYVVAPTANLIPLPSNVDFNGAAAVTLAALTAWHMLVERARLRPGEDVLVLGGASGVGSAAVQIARLMGARRVIATAGTPDKLDKARSLGADAVINHYEADIREEVRRLTAKRGVDVVVEHVGAATWEKSVACLARAGRLVTCGATTGSDVHLDIWPLFAKKNTILGSYGGTRADLRQVLDLVAAKKLAPVIDRLLPLEQLPEAHRLLEAGDHAGKIVMTV